MRVSELSSYMKETLISNLSMRLVYCLLALLIGSSSAFATHIIGGYIRATPLVGQGLTYQITVTMYYDLAAGAAATQSAMSLDVCFGDNDNAQPVDRTSIQAWSVDKSVAISEYRTTHTYSGAGVYTVQATVINRSSAINAGAGEQPLLLRTTLAVNGMANQTPVLALPATGLQQALYQRVDLPLAASDADGDSLSYALAFPLTNAFSSSTGTNLCAQVPTALRSYQFPNDVRQVGTYRLNWQTGLLSWTVPVNAGIYAVAIAVSEWRKGILLSQTQYEITLKVTDRGGSPVTLPAYEPAQLALVTAVPDADGLSLRVSPNPVTGDAVQADLFLNKAGPATLELLDNQGRMYKTVPINQPSSHHQYVFDLAGKPAGLYLIRAESAGRQLVRKVLKQ